MIIDLNSANGIIIKPTSHLKNDKKNIHSGDEIQVGEILLKLLAINQDEALQTLYVDYKELLKDEESKK